MIEPAIERNESAGGGAWLINHLPTIIWHRRLYVIVSFVVLFLVGLITAYTLPTLYRSSATMLVESPDMSKDIVEDPGGGQIEKRIANIREQVLSRGGLISLIEQNDLYPSERRSKPMSLIVDKMRESTTVGAVAGDVGSKGHDVIAVKMDFDYPDPAKAQAVMQAYVTQFLRMDSEEVEDQANLSVRFLTDQATKLQTQIQNIENQITQLKSSNGAALANAGGPTYVDTGSYTAQITALQNENRQIVAASQGQGDNSDLSKAEATLAGLQAMYSDSHPDVIAAKERVAILRRAAQNAPSTGALSSIQQEQIRANNAAIAQLIESRNNAVARANSAMAGQAAAPAIMEQAMQLEQQANALREQYRTVSTNLLKAQSGARLANEQRAERLSLVEPPNLPDAPHWPNRPLMIAGGAAAGLGLGIVLALLVELLNRPMRSPNQVNAMGLPVLGVVPILQTSSRKKRFRIFKKKRASRFA